MWQFLDYFFIAFHTSLILFNLFAWIPPVTRRWNLVTLSLTAFSWFVLGIWYGWGYCFCTDWHWGVRQRLGYHDMPHSYVSFLVEQLTGLSLRNGLVNAMTAVLFFLSLAASLWMNLRRIRVPGS
jgi:hypothetical protein